MEPYADESAFSNQALSAKLSEKRAEQDLELLRNRIRMLRMEEAKAKAKVGETKKRQEEILAVRARNEQHAQRRAEQRFMDDEKLRRQREERLTKKTEEKLAVKARFDQMYAARREEAVKRKEEEAQNERMLRSLRDEEVAKAQQRREQILAQQRRAQSELGRQRQEQQQALIHNFLKMIADEEARRREIEAEISEMEKDELEQIEKLRRLQDEQRQSFDELEFALAQ
ncbi:hypothetical protein KFE25_012312 [Diacronema lutheri]|uniref:Uncharacterized protein n=1 Tax=Diacronema lutheri TaxID=2081491 RepID=A0A8J6C9W0_DIALT|nr:hypothetical protein KFE25_012312 [Diacronema lutheri]